MISKETVDALEQGASDVFLWDDELRGFGVKITPKGRRSYVFQYRVGGREAKTRRWTIGSHGNPWTPKSARVEAKRLAQLVQQKIDPVAVEADRRRDAVDLDFAKYAERFIEEYLMIEAAQARCRRGASMIFAGHWRPACSDSVSASK